VHGLGGLDRRDRPAHDPPLNHVSDHEQVHTRERERAPSAGFGFPDAAPWGRRRLSPRAWSQPRFRQSSIFTADFTNIWSTRSPQDVLLSYLILFLKINLKRVVFFAERVYTSLPKPDSKARRGLINIVKSHAISQDQ
jgi:hypothetical protein